MLGRIIGLIAPHHCVCCGTEATLLCPRCWLDLLPPRPCCYKCLCPVSAGLLCGRCAAPLDGVEAATSYEGVAKRLVAKLKFGRAAAAADSMAEVMAARTGDCQGVIVTYVPTVSNRVRVRGYDQARLIAKRYARLKGLPCASLLVRTGHERQLGQSRQVRRHQLRKAFRFGGSKIAGKHILLIDDVLTTGSTLEAAAATLKQAGAISVRAVVFAAA